VSFTSQKKGFAFSDAFAHVQVNGYPVLGRKQAKWPMTVIEIRPFRNGWQVYEAPGVQPVFLSQE
jgi:hypothetical protein